MTNLRKCQESKRSWVQQVRHGAQTRLLVLGASGLLSGSTEERHCLSPFHFLHQFGNCTVFLLLKACTLFSIQCYIHSNLFNLSGCSKVFRASFVRKSEAWQPYLQESSTNPRATAISILFSTQGRSWNSSLALPLRIWKIQKGPNLDCHKHEQPSTSVRMKAEATGLHGLNDYWLTADYYWLLYTVTCTCFILTEPSSLHLAGVCEFQQEAPWDPIETSQIEL